MEGAKLGGLFQDAIPGVNELMVLWPSLGEPTSGIGIDSGLGICPGGARRPGDTGEAPGCGIVGPWP